MDGHLRDGCSECRESHSLWHGFNEFAEHERASRPPEDALRDAKSYLARQRARAREIGDRVSRATGLTSAIVATLVFDSLRQAMPAGMRASAAASRHLLYAASPLAIDLHLDSGRRPGRFTLAGQIADGTHPEQPPQNVRLALLSNDVTVMTFEATRLGEFHCEFERRDNLVLLILIEGREPIVIPLDALFEPTNPGLSPRSQE
jgi:hypothetical protein